MELTQSQKQDYERFYVVKPDPGFNPDKARAVIDGTIRKYEAMRRKKSQEFVEQLRERADAVATYLKSRAADNNNPIESYLGRTNLARLQGRRILQKLRNVNGHKIITFEEI